MLESLTIGSWVSADDGCEINCDVGGGDIVRIEFRGSKGQPFELILQSDPMRLLVERATQALAEMDVIANQDATGQKDGEGSKCAQSSTIAAR